MSKGHGPRPRFDGKAEEAAGFYVSLLPDSEVTRVTPYTADTTGGKVAEVGACGRRCSTAARPSALMGNG